MNKRKRSYVDGFIEGVLSLVKGLRLTYQHLLRARQRRRIVPIMDDEYFSAAKGIATVQYPHEMIPVPDNGRYRLHNEIDDCIVCDKCAKICPVDCIEIEPVRATEEIGKTSDGTPKRIYAARFDIDMGKCCFCGLCTTVCPTECLTMTKVFDFSVTDIQEHTFAFAEMSQSEIAEKKALFESYQKSKMAPPQPVVTKQDTIAATESDPSAPNTEEVKPSVAKPAAFRPKIKPPGPKPPTS
jgi:formate hydrogenlyase subunit 6/NADH:ubiquinone oxidoreductase subunit I